MVSIPEWIIASCENGNPSSCYTLQLLKGFNLEHVVIELTRKCLWSCLHCSAESSTNIDTLNELTFKEVKKIVDNCYRIGCRSFVFSGGEPFLKLDTLYNIVTYIKECLSNCKVRIHSQIAPYLLRNNPMVKKILDYVDNVSISIYSLNSEKHDWFTKSRNSLRLTLETINWYRDLEIDFEVYIVPMSWNVSELHRIIKTLYELHEVEKFRILWLQPSGRLKDLKLYAKFKPSVLQLLKSLRKIIDLLGNEVISFGCCTMIQLFKTYRILESTDRKLARYYDTVFNRIYYCWRKDHLICKAGISKLHIDAEGNVYPCTGSSGYPQLRIGNVRKLDYNIAKIWHENKVLRKYREFFTNPPYPCKLRNGTYWYSWLCGYFYECFTGCKAFKTGIYGSPFIPDLSCPFVQKELKLSVPNS